MKKGLEHRGSEQEKGQLIITTQCPTLERKSSLSKVLFKFPIRKAKEILPLLPSPHIPLPPNPSTTLSYRLRFLFTLKSSTLKDFRKGKKK